MAFDNSDTDDLYDRVLRPIAQRLGFTVIRIDRKEHNRNINDEIMAELQQADLVIADLTYTRPSVYYEAGFAERNVPVVYTVRRDHFARKSRAEDPGDTRRVHFDLSMRNIIAWDRLGDRDFAKRLRSRLQLVARPLLAERERTQLAAREERQFSLLPHSSQAMLLESALERMLLRHGFKRLNVRSREQKLTRMHWKYVLSQKSEPSNTFAKAAGRKLALVYLAPAVLRVGEVANGLNAAITRPLVNVQRAARVPLPIEKLTNVALYTIFTSPNRLSRSTLRNRLHDAHLSEDGSAFLMQLRRDVSDFQREGGDDDYGNGKSRSIPVGWRLQLFDGIRSIAALERAATPVLAGW